MNRWAASGKYDCHFLCICVLGDRSAIPLSKEMSKEAKMTHCVNAFIDNDNDMPMWGQLGCQGFIILDEQHQVVSTGTSAFMQVRALAFDHVEALLDAVCAKKPLPQVCPGEQVKLLEAPPSRPDLKGSRGIVVKLMGDNLHFGFMDGPLQGRAMECPVNSVAKLGAPKGGGGGCSTSACGTGGCSTGGCSTSACGTGGCSTGGCSTPGDCETGGCDPSSCDKPGCAPGADACDQSKCDGTGGCGKAGGCDKAGSAEQALDEEFVASSLNLVSVKVPSMDAEHEECKATLLRLVSERTAASLEAVLQCLSSHFEHEEAMFEKYSFGGNNDRFSAKKGHIEDHNRLLDNMRRQLAAVPPAGVPVGFVRELLEDFHEHTSKYDLLYADQMVAKGAH